MIDNSHRFALIIGTSKYRDPTLSQLQSPEADVNTLATVLSDPKLGNFQVNTAINQPHLELHRQITMFFRNKCKDDLLLLYFSGHGIRDEEGNLFLATCDTEREFISFTTISAREITELMDRSMSKRNILILDCCYSGAFAIGAKGGLGCSIGSKQLFKGNGYGRIVLTATDSLQYAWDGRNSILGELSNSVFTHFLIDGIKSGDADINQDGFITVDELYEYIYEKIILSNVNQSPSKWSYKEQGEMLIAYCKKKSATYLPSDIENALNSSFPPVRLGAVYALKSICLDDDELVKVAIQKLESLQSDPNSNVAKAATDALISLEKLFERVNIINDEKIIGVNKIPVFEAKKEKTREKNTQSQKSQTHTESQTLLAGNPIQAMQNERALLSSSVQKKAEDLLQQTTVPVTNLLRQINAPATNLLQQINAPATNLLQQINAPATNLLYLIQAYIAKQNSKNSSQ